MADLNFCKRIKKLCCQATVFTSGWSLNYVSHANFVIMKNILLIAISFIISFPVFSQTQRKISTYFSVQYNTTIYDRTSGNNPWSIGAGLQAFYNNRTKFKPTIEITADGAIEDDKILRVNPDGKEVQDADGVINLFAGSSFQASQKFYLSFLFGPSFINSNTYFGIKPSVGYYFSKRQKLGAKISYINVFNREPNYEETKMLDFGSISLSINIKLF